MVPMATKLVRMITYLEGLLPVKSHNPWIRSLAKLHEEIEALYLQY